MSHFKERKERNCLNCNAVVYGRYCHMCSQENVEPKETFGHLVTHFVYDITHFDGKFFSSLKYLLFKPGYLPAEYIRGRRMSYLNPIKMYVFVSAFFFLFFFTFMKPVVNTNENEGKTETYREVKSRIEKRIKTLEGVLNEKKTPADAKEVAKAQLADLHKDLVTLEKDTTDVEELNYYKSGNVTFSGVNYKDVHTYDSLQNSLPANKRDNWLDKIIKKKKIELKIKYGNRGNEFLEKLLEKFFHSFPQIFFVSLPLFALILKMLYIRRRNYYYADHIIYSVHLYCATFVFMFFLLSAGLLKKFAYLHWLTFVIVLVSVYVIWFQYKSMLNFYRQGRGKTLLKFFLVLFLSSFTMVFLFSVSLVLSLFTI